MRALVTGGGVRLGRQIALALADCGYDLVLHCFSSREGAEGVAQEARARGVSAVVVPADLGTVEGCAALCAEAGAVDVLVNNAALYEAVPFGEMSVASWERMLAVNTRAPALLAQGLLPGLRASLQEGGGVIINICDIGGDRPAPGYTHYSVSKAGIRMLTRALAVELAPQVRVNSVSPGTVLPPVELSEDAAAAILSTIPAGRFGTADDIARAVVFLVTQAPYITGQDLAVCGGRSIAGAMLAG